MRANGRAAGTNVRSHRGHAQEANLRLQITKNNSEKRCLCMLAWLARLQDEAEQTKGEEQKSLARKSILFIQLNCATATATLTAGK